MSKTLGFAVLAVAISAAGSSGAMAASGPLPDPTECVSYDQIICSYQIVDGAALATGQSLGLA